MSDRAPPNGATAATKSSSGNDSKAADDLSILAQMDSRELLMNDKLFHSLPLDEMIRKSDPEEIDRLFMGHMKQYLWKSLQPGSQERQPLTPSTVASTITSRRDRVKYRLGPSARFNKSHRMGKNQLVIQGAATAATASMTTAGSAKSSQVAGKRNQQVEGIREGRQEEQSSPPPNKGIKSTAISETEETRQAASPPVSFRGGIVSSSNTPTQKEDTRTTSENKGNKAAAASDASDAADHVPLESVVATVEESFASRFDALQQSIDGLPTGNGRPPNVDVQQTNEDDGRVSPRKLKAITEAMESHFAPRFDAIEGSLSSIQQTLALLANNMIQAQQPRQPTFQHQFQQPQFQQHTRTSSQQHIRTPNQQPTKPSFPPPTNPFMQQNSQHGSPAAPNTPKGPRTGESSGDGWFSQLRTPMNSKLIRSNEQHSSVPPDRALGRQSKTLSATVHREEAAFDELIADEKERTAGRPYDSVEPQRTKKRAPSEDAVTALELKPHNSKEKRKERTRIRSGDNDSTEKPSAPERGTGNKRSSKFAFDTMKDETPNSDIPMVLSPRAADDIDVRHEEDEIPTTPKSQVEMPRRYPKELKATPNIISRAKLIMSRTTKTPSPKDTSDTFSFIKRRSMRRSNTPIKDRKRTNSKDTHSVVKHGLNETEGLTSKKTDEESEAYPTRALTAKSQPKEGNDDQPQQPLNLKQDHLEWNFDDSGGSPLRHRRVHGLPKLKDDTETKTPTTPCAQSDIVRHNGSSAAHWQRVAPVQPLDLERDSADDADSPLRPRRLQYRPAGTPFHKSQSWDDATNASNLRTSTEEQKDNLSKFSAPLRPTTSDDVPRRPERQHHALSSADSPPSSADHRGNHKRKTVTISPAPPTHIPPPLFDENPRGPRKKPSIMLNENEYPFRDTSTPTSIPRIKEPAVRRRAHIPRFGESPSSEAPMRSKRNRERNGLDASKPPETKEQNGAKHDKHEKTELEDTKNVHPTEKKIHTQSSQAKGCLKNSKHSKSSSLKDIPTSISLLGGGLTTLNSSPLPGMLAPATPSTLGHQEIDETFHQTPLIDCSPSRNNGRLLGATAWTIQTWSSPMAGNKRVPAREAQEACTSPQNKDASSQSSSHPSDEEDELMAIESPSHVVRLIKKLPRVRKIKDAKTSEPDLESIGQDSYHKTSVASSKSYLTDEWPEVDASPTDETPISLSNLIKSLAEEEARMSRTRLENLKREHGLKLTGTNSETTVSDISGIYQTVQSLPEYLGPQRSLQNRSYTFPVPCPKVDENMMSLLKVLPSSEESETEETTNKARDSGDSKEYASPANSILDTGNDDGGKALSCYPQPSSQTKTTEGAPEEQKRESPKEEKARRSPPVHLKDGARRERTSPPREHPSEILVVEEDDYLSPSGVSTVSYSVSTTRTDHETALTTRHQLVPSTSNSQGDMDCCSPSSTLKLLTAGNHFIQIPRKASLKKQGDPSRGSVVWSNPGHKPVSHLVAKQPDERLLLPTLDTFPQNNPAFAIIAQKIAEAEAALKAELARENAAKRKKAIGHYTFDQDTTNNDDDDDSDDDEELSGLADLKKDMEIYIPTGPRPKQITFTPANVIRSLSPGPTTTILTDSGERYIELVHMGKAALFDNPTSPAASSVSGASSSLESNTATSNLRRGRSYETKSTKTSFLERFQARTEKKGGRPQQHRKQKSAKKGKKVNKKKPKKHVISPVPEQKDPSSGVSDVNSSPPNSSVSIGLILMDDVQQFEQFENTEQEAAQIIEIVERYYHYHTRYNAGNPDHFVMPLSERKKQPLDQLLGWTMVAFEEIERDFLTSFHNKAKEDGQMKTGAMFGEESSQERDANPTCKVDAKEKSTRRAVPKAGDDGGNDGDDEKSKGRHKKSTDPLERVGIFNLDDLDSSSSNMSDDSTFDDDDEDDSGSSSSLFSDDDDDGDDTDHKTRSTLSE
ncbi:expressed unknown protein [Seminavis robusta]|uniref:Uncharacterized protein n=1 Tax=Seminavis robusta TaxID=568900 RepID=A0A9N8DI20_9STRA|nr:expressed unknown protein [Seminavis robusta]|eukprot:Sro100_g051390.1 n/a (1936) ;mRNA; f:102368-108264